MKKITEVMEKDNKTNLKQSFMDACSDKEFKEYVYNLNIKEDILINYTSNLQDAYIEYNNCANCKGLSSCTNKLQGYRYTPYLDKDIINFEYAACDREVDKIQKDKYLSNISSFEMPKNIREASFKNIYKDDKLRLPIIKYFKEFMADYKKEDKPKGLYLHGSFGSGKTYLIASLFNEMAHKEIKSVLVYYPEFLRSLKSSFNTDFEDKFDTIKRAPLLLLDDIGAENESAWSRDEILSPILQYRMEENLPTFFTSNLTIDELEKFFSITSSGVDKVKARRIVERIKQLTIDQELVSKNRRG